MKSPNKGKAVYTQNPFSNGQKKRPAGLACILALSLFANAVSPALAFAMEEHTLAGQDKTPRLKAWTPGHHNNNEEMKKMMEVPDMYIEEDTICKFNNIQDPLPAQTDIRSIMGALRSDSGDISTGGSCFDQLQPEDRIFMAQFADKLAAACLTVGPNGPAEKPDCKETAEKVWTNELREHRKNYGTAALERVLSAYTANSKRNDAMAALEKFSKPEAAASFRNFARAYVNYLGILSEANHDEIQGDGALAHTRRLVRKVVDGLEVKADPNGRIFPKNPLVRQHQAAEGLLWAHLDLSDKVSKMDLPEGEKKALLAEVSALYSHASDRTQVTADRMEEDRAIGKLGLSGVGAAAMLLVSMESMGLGMKLAGGAKGIAAGAGIGYVANGTMNAQPLTLTQAVRAALNAKSEAGKKGSRFLCELSNHFTKNSEKDIMDVWNRIHSGGKAGAAVVGVTSAVGKFAPAAGAILSGFMLIPLSGAMVLSMYQMEQMRQSKDKTLNAKVAEAKEKLAKGEISEGMYRDIERIVERERGKQLADRIGEGSMMASMVPHIPHTAMAFPEAVTAEAIERAEAGMAHSHQH